MKALDRVVSMVFLMVLCSIVYLPCTEANAFSVGVNIRGDTQPPEMKQTVYAHLYLFGEAGMEDYGQDWVSWNRIEPSPPFEGVHNYDWSALDQDIQEIEAVGGTMYPILMSDAPWAIETTQAWSSPPKDDAICAQDNPDMGMSCWDAWRDLVSAVVERYDDDGVDDMPGLQRAHLYWQIGTEYENAGQWNTADGTQRAEKYVALLEAAHDEAKQANLGARIICFSFNFGDVFDHNPSVADSDAMTYPQTVPQRDFTVQVWQQAADYFDMVGTNVNYHYNGIPARVRWIRSHLDKPIWIHEGAVAHLLDRRFIQPPLYDESVYPYKTETEIGEILVLKDHPEHDVIKKWWEKEKAKYAIKKAIIAAGQGVTFMGFTKMFDIMGTNDFWGTIAEMAWDIGVGILEGGFDDEPTGTPKPVYYTMKMFNQKVGNPSSVADLNPLPEGVNPANWTWKIRFTKDDQETLVLWSEGQQTTEDLSSYFSTANIKITHIVTELDESYQPIYPDDEIVSAHSVPIDDTPIFVDEFYTPYISEVYPRQQEPTILNPWIPAPPPYNTYSNRPGLVRLTGNNFGSSQMNGDKVKIGTYAKYTADPIGNGVPLRILVWSSEQIGVYLLPESGFIVPSLYYIPGWIGSWKLVWIVKDNDRAPVASNVRAVRLLTPSP